MRAVARRDAVCDSTVSFDLFAGELIAALATLLPEVRVVPRADGFRFGRGSATAEVTLQRDGFAAVVLRHGMERVLGGAVALTAEGLNDLGADLVGFFCGASLVTLSVFPRAEPVAKPSPRPRRRGPYDAPLIPLPYEPVKLRL